MKKLKISIISGGVHVAIRDELCLSVSADNASAADNELRSPTDHWSNDHASPTAWYRVSWGKQFLISQFKFHGNFLLDEYLFGIPSLLSKAIQMNPKIHWNGV